MSSQQYIPYDVTIMIDGKFINFSCNYTPSTFGFTEEVYFFVDTDDEEIEDYVMANHIRYEKELKSKIRDIRQLKKEDVLPF